MRPYEIIRIQGSSADDISRRWRERRKLGIGGSDAGAIIGVNPYRSPLAVWCDKTGRSDDIEPNEFMEWGNRLEAIVTAKFAEIHPDMLVHRVNGMIVSRERPWQFANIDRRIREADGSSAVLEVKTAGALNADHWKSGPPPTYVAQVTHYLAVTGWQRGYIAVLIGGNDYREYTIRPSAEEIAFITKSERVFWEDFVQTNTMPKMVGLSDEAKALLNMYPSAMREFTQGGDDQDMHAQAVIELKRERNRIVKELKRHENALRHDIGDAYGLITESYKVIWSRTDGRDYGLRVKEF